MIRIDAAGPAFYDPARFFFSQQVGCHVKTNADPAGRGGRRAAGGPDRHLGRARALRGEPEFYQQAVARDVVLAEQSSDEFLQQAAGVASDVRRMGHWDAVFTADQINGWLAVDMHRNHPGLLPESLSDPRISITPGDATLACRYQGPQLDAVLTISCDVYLSPPSAIAIRIKGAHAGLMPLPLGKVLDAIAHTAQKLEIPLEWRRSGGDPVALLTLAPPHNGSGDRRQIELDTIELRDGELYVAGRTEHSLASVSPHATQLIGATDTDGTPITPEIPADGEATVGTPAAAAEAEGQPRVASPPVKEALQR